MYRAMRHLIFWWGAEGNGDAVSNVCVSAAGGG